MAKKSKKSRKLSVYSNLLNSRKIKKDAEIKKHAQYLATLPKNPIKRFFYRLSPKHFFKYWFSKRGAKMFIKIVGIAAILLCIVIGGLFAYFRKDIDSIRPGELAKSVQTTVSTYYDRNGEILWEDKGDGDYTLVVNSGDISKYLKDATVAIEDKDFYKHGGVSASGLLRAVINNIGGGSTQGGSTLTQQLVKQVFFANEATKRGLNGIPRKIKEMILSIEVERMYNKDQILTLYLNESPYGGRRNGVESAAQTYFGVSAKNLTLAQAALLAAIPQNPSVFNPYNVAGHEGLIARQHTVLDDMAAQGYITKAQDEEAKAVPIIDTIIPESNQYTNIKAAHFVQMVRAELVKELGETIVGKGGLKVTTTLDLKIQTKLEEAMNDMFNSTTPTRMGFSNGAATVEDTKTGQIVALLGSRDFDYAGYGQDNAATSFIQPGSSVKPLVYSELFEKKTGVNYGSGSVLKDENIDSIYGAPLYNADHKFNGDITIRAALATSRNIPAVKAMYISGVSTTISKMHDMGAISYCTDGNDTTVGLAAAIGGCGIKQIDLVSAYSTLGRQGVYKDQSMILEVKNNSDEILEKWTDPAGAQVIDAQSAYIVSDILSDDNARALLDGHHALGMDIPGVKTATKTGTSDKGGNAKDIWMVSYSPALTMAVWLGNSDGTILKVGTSSTPGVIIDKVMSYAHKEVYAAEGKWTPGDWFTKPSGIQTAGTELFPSWWSKTQGQTKTTKTFDTISKKLATVDTPPAAKVDLEVTKTVDPVTKKDIYTATDTSFDASKNDDLHLATDLRPTITVKVEKDTSAIDNNTYKITIEVSQGTRGVTTVNMSVGGVPMTLEVKPGTQTLSYIVKAASTEDQTVTAYVKDDYLYENTSTATMPKYDATAKK